jgi:hypothetical protein
MSSQASVVNIPSALIGDVAPANWISQNSGSVYRAVPLAVGNQEVQGFLIDAFGRLQVIGAAARNAAYVASNPLSIGGVYDAVLPTYDDGDQVTDQHDSRGRKIVNDDQLLAAFIAEDFATETTLAAILADTAIISAVDFATQTTLAAVLADTTSIAAEDFATQTTLAAVLADTTSIAAEDFATQTTLAAVLADTTSIAAEDFATQTTLAAVLADTTSIAAEDFATEATLAAILADTAIMSVWDTNAGVVGANTQRVHLTTENLASLDPGKVFTSTYTDASSTNIPGNASLPLQLIASTGSAIKEIQVFDTTGFFLEIMTGAAAVETRVALVGPGQDQPIKLNIPAATRVSVRRVDGAAALAIGSLAINYLS